MTKAFSELEKAQAVLNGRVGAINLEQLDVLLESLKSSWDYSSQLSFLDEIKASPVKVSTPQNEYAYEL